MTDLQQTFQGTAILVLAPDQAWSRLISLAGNDRVPEVQICRDTGDFLVCETRVRVVVDLRKQLVVLQGGKQQFKRPFSDSFQKGR